MNCLDCKHCERNPLAVNEGRCLFNPPIPLVLGGQLVSVYPPVGPTSLTCRQFAKSEPVKSDDETGN